MAERSAKKKNYGQSYMYLRSAENLITLVEDMNYECSQARQVVIAEPKFSEEKLNRNKDG